MKQVLTSFEHLQIQTERLLLRPLRPSDAADLFTVRSDPRAMRYWSSSAWREISVAEKRIADAEEDMRGTENLCFGLERLSDHRMIGTAELFGIDAPCRRSEIGYSLLVEAWGKGYMGEALQALVNLGFQELNLNRIEADIDPRNTPSRRCLERLGFKQEGYLRERWIVNDEVCDSALYGLILSDWDVRSAVNKSTLNEKP